MSSQRLDLQKKSASPNSSFAFKVDTQIRSIGIWIVFILAFVALIAAPILAYNWSTRPFPGFLVEQTLVVSSNGDSRWNGLAAGMNFPHRVIGVNTEIIGSERDFDTVVSRLKEGQAISIKTDLPDGKITYFYNIGITTFDGKDLFRLFWIPYLIGCFFLLVGVWVFRVRQTSNAGRAFSYFCANAALTTILLFDLWTSHSGTLVWTFAIAQIGGAMIGLAATFPEEATTGKVVVIIRSLAYLLSLILAGWGFVTIIYSSNPWSYVEPWRYSYIYSAIGIAIFLATMAIRSRTRLSATGREQVRIILWGSIIAFTPIAFWMSSSLFRIAIPFNPIIFLIPLLMFPLTIGIAIVRYRLWDLDDIIRTTIVYSLLAVVLIAVYLSLIVVFGEIVQRTTGLGEFFSIFATFLIVVLYTPLRKWIKRLVDRQMYRRLYENEKKLTKFNESLVDAVNLDDINDEMIRFVEETMQPEFADLWLLRPTKSGHQEKII